jgi:hypothetical protein
MILNPVEIGHLKFEYREKDKGKGGKALRFVKLLTEK